MLPDRDPYFRAEGVRLAKLPSRYFFKLTASSIHQSFTFHRPLQCNHRSFTSFDRSPSMLESCWPTGLRNAPISGRNTPTELPDYPKNSDDPGQWGMSHTTDCSGNGHANERIPSTWFPKGPEPSARRNLKYSAGKHRQPYFEEIPRLIGVGALLGNRQFIRR